MNEIVRLPLGLKNAEGNIDLAGILGFALMTLVTIAVAKRIPFIKTFV